MCIQEGVAWGSSLFFFSLLMFYLFLRMRETEHERGRGREIERDTESETGSRLQAVSTEPNTGLEPTNCEVMT